MLIANKDKKFPTPLLVIFFSFVVVISILAFWLYSLSKEEIRDKNHEELATISNLRVKQITDWRTERLREAEFIMKSTQFKQLIFTYLKNPSDKKSLQDVVAWIKPLKENHEYNDIVLIDLKGKTYPLFSKKIEKLSSADQAVNKSVLYSGKITLTDFHRYADTGYIHIGIILPIYSSKPKTDIFCTLMLRLDPNENLFPLIQTWPSQSKTAETIVIRREGNYVVFLNELRHKKNTALKLKFPISDEQLPAAMAARGKTGMVEGIDYRGVKVLADINAIPDSRWYIIAKIDLEEILTPLKERTLTIIFIAGILILLTGVTVYLFWKQQQVQHYKKQYNLEIEKQALQKHYEYLIKNANDIILLSDDYFEIIEVNDSALKAYGYTREEFRKLTIVNIHAPETRRLIAYHKNLVDNQSGLIFETKHIRKNGEVFDVEVSSKLIEIEDKKYYQNIIRDITEKKQNEKKILQHNRVYSVLSNVNQTIVRRRNREDLFKECCRIAVEDGQFRLTWIGLLEENTNKIQVVSKCGYDDGYLDNISITINGNQTGLGPTGTAVREGKYFICNNIETDERMKHWRDNALKRNYLSCAAFPIKLFEKPIGTINFYSTEKDFFDEEEIKLLEEMAMDISYALEFMEQEEKRKQSEGALRLSEFRLRSTMDNMMEGCQIINDDWIYIYINDAAEIHNRRPKEELLGKRYMDMWPGIEETEVFSSIKRCKEERIFVAMENRFVYPDGIAGWFELSIQPIPEGVFILSADITERKQSLELLWENEQKYRSLFENSLDAILLTSPNGKILSANSAACKMLGYTEQELTRIERNEIVDYADPRLSPLLEEREKTGSAKGELTMIRKNGIRFQVEISSEIFLDARGEKKSSMIIRDITERKHAEKALNESEQRLRLAITAANQGLYDVNIETGETFVNDEYAIMLGYDPATFEETTDTWIERLHPEDREKTVLNYKAYVKGEVPEFKIEFRQHTKDGKWKWILSIGKIVEYDSDGTPLRLLGTHTDIDKQKKSEEEIKILNSRLQELINTIKALSSARNLDTVQRIITNSARKLTSADGATIVYRENEYCFYADEDAIEPLWKGKRFLLSDCISGWVMLNRKIAIIRDIYSDDRIPIEAYKPTFVKSLAVVPVNTTEPFAAIGNYWSTNHTPTKIEIDLLQTLADSAAIAIENVKLYEELEKRVIERTEELNKAMLVLENEVEERKIIQEQLQKYSDEVTDLYDNAPCGYHSLDQNGYFMRINKTETDWIGFSEDELIGKFKFSDLITEESKEVFLTNFPVFKEKGFISDLEFDMVRKDGSTFSVLVNATAIKDENGNYLSGRSTLFDITELKKIRESVKDKAKMLEQANKELEAFSYSVSHDLRAPLRAINGFSNILLISHKEQLDKDAQTLLLDITASTQKMSQLIDDLLEFSRLGRKELAKTDINMSALIKSIADEQIENSGDRKIDLNIYNLPDAKADYSLIKQVLVNLISNAIKFTSKREMSLIEIGGKSEAGENIYWIKDNGVGFDTKYSDKLFGVFQRLHREDEFEGTGVGLAIVKSVISKHGGKVWAESILDEGSTFYFSLPGR